MRWENPFSEGGRERERNEREREREREREDGGIRLSGT